MMLSVFIGDGAALGEGRRTQRLEFLFHPAGADPDRKPALRQKIDGGKDLGGEHRRAMRRDHDRCD
jgi:hypothetical protein